MSQNFLQLDAKGMAAHISQVVAHGALAADMEIEQRFNIPGGEVVVIYARLVRGELPVAFISSEPIDASIGRTRIRDAVKLLNALRDWGKVGHFQMLFDADASLQPVWGPALTLKDAA